MALPAASDMLHSKYEHTRVVDRNSSINTRRSSKMRFNFGKQEILALEFSCSGAARKTFRHTHDISRAHMENREQSSSSRPESLEMILSGDGQSEKRDDSTNRDHVPSTLSGDGQSEQRDETTNRIHVLSNSLSGEEEMKLSQLLGPERQWESIFPAYMQSRTDDDEQNPIPVESNRGNGCQGVDGARAAAAAAASARELESHVKSSSATPLVSPSVSAPPGSSAKPPTEGAKNLTELMFADPIWAAMRAEARLEAEKEPLLSSYLYASILAHSCFERALGFVLANRLQNPTLLATQLMDVFDNVFMNDGDIQQSIRLDVQAVKERDPSCRSYSWALLYLKGYHALQSYRAAHALWNRGQHVLALALQSRISEVFAVDIHPAARIGKGILLDHGTGVVIGETAVVGDRVSMLQGVTLGGTGKEIGDRHPKIGEGVLIGAGATILGNLTVGKGAMVAAGSLVLKDMALDEKNQNSSSINTLSNNVVLILDFGSQYTHLITRRIRQLAVCSVCLSGTSSLSAMKTLNPSVIILSGGPHSVHEEGAPLLPDEFFDYVLDKGTHVLGICYGLQLIVKQMGGEVKPAKSQEYGRMEVRIHQGSKLFGDIFVGERQSVWMSHGDEVVRLPEGFQVVATSLQNAIAAIENPHKRLYGLQYHPEVTHSVLGMETLRFFLFSVCGIIADWKLEDVLEEQIQKIKQMVGPEDHAICALSGGVDSTVAATLVHKALGDKLHCAFVDNGLLRYNERERVMVMFENDLHLPVNCIDATERFLDKLKGVTDPERKRKIIGGEFIHIFDEFSVDLEKKLGRKPKFLVQGTLYPDVIESCPPPGSGRNHSHTIKSHHNVGGLPAEMNLKLIEPLNLLFKDEVRKLGEILSVPQGFLKRHPFPGPGLAVRILGDVTEGNALETIRLVDEIFINSIKDAGLYDQIWQAFAVFLPVKTVGVQGDRRTHSHAVALRAITSEDGMTADWYQFDPKFLAEVSSKICNSVHGVNRIVYDITSKPPSTVEWE